MTILTFILLLITILSQNITGQLVHPFYRRKFIFRRNTTSPTQPRINVRAVIQNCDHVNSLIREANERNGNVSQVPLQNCAKKIIATIGLEGMSPDSQTIVVNELFDSETGKRSILVNPYVVILHQNPMEQIYQLEYLHDVNGEAKEEIINKRRTGFKGCDDFSDNPTCGKMFSDGKIIPFSQGFCCSCDEKTNKKRQPEEYAKENEKIHSTPNTNGFMQILAKFGIHENDNGGVDAKDISGTWRDKKL